MSYSLPVVEISAPARRRFLERLLARDVPRGCKRMFDILVAVGGLLMLSPLLIAVALMIKWMAGTDVIYGHRRVGKNGQPFRCLKFRTMAQNGEEILRDHLARNPEAAREWEATHKLKDDPRITPLGRVLRVTSIDELPQLLNILAGQMSCVGPRPITFHELARYDAAAGDYLRMRPGLTGLWQVSGRSTMSYPERVALDASYVRDWSLALDIVILCRTVPALLRSNETS